MPKPRICVKPKPTEPIIPNTPELPLDIIEVIIEKLCEDEPNLTSVKACCLVCYDFVDICRKRIFASISLSTVGPYGTPRPSNYFFWKQNGHVKKFNRLLTKAPSVAKYIREMEFDPYRDNMFFRAFLPHMDKINRLISFRSYGDFLQWDREYSCAPLLRIFQLPDLIALDLSAFCNFDLADLECCVKLEQLRFRTIQLYNYSPRLQCTRQSPLKLRGLSIGHASYGVACQIDTVICADGRPLINLARLDSLSVEVVDANDIRFLGFVSRCVHLITLNLKLTLAISSLEGMFEAVVPSLRTLKYINLEAAFYFQGVAFTDPFCHVVAELEKMSNKNVIETLDIHLILDFEMDTTDVHMQSRLEGVFNKSGWPHLQQVWMTVGFRTKDINVRRAAIFKRTVERWREAGEPPVPISYYSYMVPVPRRV